MLTVYDNHSDSAIDYQQSADTNSMQMRFGSLKSVKKSSGYIKMNNQMGNSGKGRIIKEVFNYSH